MSVWFSIGTDSNDRYTGMKHLRQIVKLLGVFLVMAPSPGLALIQEPKRPDEDLIKARQELDEHIRKLNSPTPIVAPITGDDVVRLLPAYCVFSVRFRMFPVAASPPDPLRSQNVFLVLKPGK